MNDNQCQVFKYKGRKFIVKEMEFKTVGVPGIKKKEKDCDFIFIRRSLSARQKQLHLHRLITGRGLGPLIKGGARY